MRALPRAASRGRGPGEASQSEDPAEGQDDRAQEEPDIGSAVPRRIRRRHMDGDRSEGALPHGVVSKQLRCQRYEECNFLICLTASADDDEVSIAVASKNVSERAKNGRLHGLVRPQPVR